MSNDELQRLKQRIEQVRGFIVGLEQELRVDPADFDAKMTLISMRDHLREIQRQRADLEGK